MTNWAGVSLVSFIAMTIVMNVLGDYLSLLESRFVIRRMQSPRPNPVALLLIDFLFTLLVFLVCYLVISPAIFMLQDYVEYRMNTPGFVFPH